jgi:6-pyruvoyltetrahydropterin/6-carboxytetrahydropterin synthase
MIRLSREIRFTLVNPAELSQQLDHPNQKNSWASWPITNRIAPHLVLSAIVEGTPDPETGYLCNVTLIDKALRSFVSESLVQSMASVALAQLPSAEQIVRQALLALSPQTFETASLCSVTLHLSPYLSYTIDTRVPEMIQLTHQFEFSAAHRLHCDSMSADENLATFGKCNNPAGHGHNYVVEVSVAGDISGSAENDSVIELGKLAEIVNRNVIDPLDHKNLNEDIAHFANVNPSVENICVAVYDWLKADIESAGCRLAEVKVFETPKTWACYRG